MKIYTHEHMHAHSHTLMMHTPNTLTLTHIALAHRGFELWLALAVFTAVDVWIQFIKGV